MKSTKTIGYSCLPSQEKSADGIEALHGRESVVIGAYCLGLDSHGNHTTTLDLDKKILVDMSTTKNYPNQKPVKKNGILKNLLNVFLLFMLGYKRKKY